MAKQKTDWGEILWMNEEADLMSVEGLKVGMVTLNTGGHQARHIHFEEQVIYVVQGQAVSTVGREEVRMKPGDYFHWPAGIFHEVYNTGEVPFQHLMVAHTDFDDFALNQETKYAEQEVSADILYAAVEAIRTQFLENLNYSYVIFDTAGNVVLQSRLYPSYCTGCCRPQENRGSCPCMIRLGGSEKQEEQTFVCPFGMEVFHFPIVFHGSIIGYIQGGYIRHAGMDSVGAREVYDVPESVVAGIRGLMLRIVKAIKNYCEFEQFHRELTQRELRIATGEESRRMLNQSLQDAQYAMTDLKINNHFLFNTLNSMASMAVESNALALYQSIVDLSKMFHYTLRTQSAQVPLEKELEYLRAYLKLQKLRYGDALEVSYDIDASLLQTMVPFNFMQPVAENAFIHGFEEASGKRLRIEVGQEKSDIAIKIRNSGKNMTRQMCETVNRSLKAGVSHGLSMIYRKLRAVYDDQFMLFICPEDHGGSCCVVRFPIRRREKNKTGKEEDG